MARLTPTRSLRYGLVILLSAGGFCADLYAFWPGFMSPDTMDQFKQALHNSYSTWHPPTMAAFWRLLMGFKVGPEPMLVFQLLLLWGAFAVLLDILLQRAVFAAPLLLLLFCSPFVQNIAGNVWKDLHMSFSWLLAFSLMLQAYLKSERLKPVISAFCLLLIIYGTWVRLSGFPGTVPLLYFWWRLSTGAPFARRPWVAGLAALLLCLGILKLESFFSKQVLHAKKDHFEYKLIMHDLSGLSIRSKELCFPSMITQHPGFDYDYIVSHYSVVSFDNIWWNPDHKNLMPNLTEEQHAELYSFWLRAIRTHPKEYLRMKAEGSLYFMRIRNSGSHFMIMFPHIMPNNFGFSYQPNWLGEKILTGVDVRFEKSYMRPWFWLLVNAALFLLCFAPKLKPHRELFLVINASAFFYLAIHFFVYPADTDFRYFYWYSLILSLAAILVLTVLPGNKSTLKK